MRINVPNIPPERRLFLIYIEVIELFSEEAIYSYNELTAYIQDGDINHVIQWNKTKDYVAYARFDMLNEGTNYDIYVSNIYEEGYVKVYRVEGEMPDLNWFYNILEIHLASFN